LTPPDEASLNSGQVYAVAEDQACSVRGVHVLPFWEQHVVSLDGRGGEVSEWCREPVRYEFVVDLVGHLERQTNRGECRDDRAIAVRGGPREEVSTLERPYAAVRVRPFLDEFGEICQKRFSDASTLLGFTIVSRRGGAGWRGRMYLWNINFVGSRSIRGVSKHSLRLGLLVWSRSVRSSAFTYTERGRFLDRTSSSGSSLTMDLVLSLPLMRGTTTPWNVEHSCRILPYSSIGLSKVLWCRCEDWLAVRNEATCRVPTLTPSVRCRVRD